MRIYVTLFCLVLCSSSFAQGIHVQVVEDSEYTVQGRTVVGGADLTMKVPKELYDALPSKERLYRVKTRRHRVYVTVPALYNGPDLVVDDGRRHTVKPPGDSVGALRKGLEKLKYGAKRITGDQRRKALAEFREDAWSAGRKLASGPRAWQPEVDLDKRTRENDRMFAMMEALSAAMGEPSRKAEAKETRREIRERLRGRAARERAVRPKPMTGELHSADEEKPVDWKALAQGCDKLLGKLRNVRGWAKVVDVEKGRQIVLYSGKREMARKFVPKDVHDIKPK